MGNRGCLHDDAGRIIRMSDRAAWISCVPSWPGIRRQLMAPGHYTELFFLDEPTALAAGHRPCGSCRPEALRAFKEAWAVAHHLSCLPRVVGIDASLRQAPENDVGRVDGLPDGAMIEAQGVPLLKSAGQWLAWSFDGYVQAGFKPTMGRALTPKPILRTLMTGYAPSGCG